VINKAKWEGFIEMAVKWSEVKWSEVRCREVLFYLFIYLFGLWDYRHCGHSWPIVPASGDNEDDCGEHDGK
jgi:hypothetical protein